MSMSDTGCEEERRLFLKSGAIIATAAALWLPTPAEAKRILTGREVSFRNLHTGEEFKGEYFYNGRYQKDAFKEIRKVLRDHRENSSFPIDPRLMDIIFVLQSRLENSRPYEVLSGYRSPKTNKMLRDRSIGVAKRSLHMQGQAIDLRLPGTRLKNLRKQASHLQAGGVGYYSRSQFIHLDTGRVRQW